MHVASAVCRGGPCSDVDDKLRKSGCKLGRMKYYWSLFGFKLASLAIVVGIHTIARYFHTPVNCAVVREAMSVKSIAVII